MNIIDTVYEMGFIDWTLVALIAVYCLMWFGKVEMFVNPEKRFFRIEAFDNYFLNGFLGMVLLQIKNAVILLILIITLLIVL